MLIVNLLLLSALAPAGQAVDGPPGTGRIVMLAAAGLLALSMLVVIARRAGIWPALYAVGLMSIGAIAVLPSLVFMRMAAAAVHADTEVDDDAAPDEPDDPARR